MKAGGKTVPLLFPYYYFLSPFALQSVAFLYSGFHVLSLVLSHSFIQVKKKVDLKKKRYGHVSHRSEASKKKARTGNISH